MCDSSLNSRMEGLFGETPAATIRRSRWRQDDMKFGLLTTAACAAALIIGLVAQERPGEFRVPVSRLATALDSDHDGTISAAEMRSAPVSLALLDANGDGQLSPDELRPSFGGRRGGEAGFGQRGG